MRILLLLLCLLSQSACARPAPSLAWTDKIEGEGFTHALFATREPVAGRVVRVYLEGDGAPFDASGRVVSLDPRARSSLVMDLASVDATGVVVARPCYHRQDARCHPWFWTDGRYSEEVVASMAQVMQTLVNRYQLAELTIVGYSGGGVLAVLLADRLPAVTAVITIAANLDVEAWQQANDFSVMDGSLNPATVDVMRPELAQLHLFGRDDDQIRPENYSRYFAKHPRSRQLHVDGFNHACCWRDIWPDVLAQLDDSHDIEKVTIP